MKAPKNFSRNWGLKINWDAGDYISFQKDESRFILQQYDEKAFAENFLLSVKVDDMATFRDEVIQKQLPQRFGIRISEIMQ